MTRRSKRFVRFSGDAALRKEVHREVQQYLDDGTIDNRGETHWSFLDVSDDPIDMRKEEQKRWPTLLNREAYPGSPPRQFPYARINYENQNIVSAQLRYISTSLFTSPGTLK